jgi:hypothetical protein
LKQTKKSKLGFLILVELVIGIGVVVGFLFYQAEYTFVSTMDSVVISGILLFTIGWLIYVVDVGIFDIATYGVKQFGLALVRKRPKKTLDEHLYERERVDKSVYLSLFITGGIIIAIGSIMYAYYYLG